MNKQRIIRLRISHQPLHRTHHIGLGRHTHGILLVIRKNDHILASIAMLLMQERRHIGNIVDAAFQLVGLTDVVDSDKQGAASTGTGGVLEMVVGGGAVAEVLGDLRGWRGEVVVP